MGERETSTTFQIKPIDPEKWAEYKKIRLEALQNDPHAFGASYDQETELPDEAWQWRLEMSRQENSPSIFFAAEDIQGDFVGMVGAFQIEGNRWEMASMYVDPIARGKGIGKKLVDALLQSVEARSDISSLELMVNTKQDDAVKLYQATGFSIARTAAGQVMGNGEKHDEYVMVKNLDRKII